MKNRDRKQNKILHHAMRMVLSSFHITTDLSGWLGVMETLKEGRDAFRE